MPKKSVALEAKFEIAVKTLLKAPNLTVQEGDASSRIFDERHRKQKYAENFTETHSRLSPITTFAFLSSEERRQNQRSRRR